MRHTLSVLVENEFGVLARIAGMFSARGFNIESLTVAETLDPTVSRMTIITRGSDQIIEQITKQLHRLVNVLKVVDVTEEGDYIAREMVLIKVNADGHAREEVLRLVEIFRARIVDVSPRTMTVEVTGDEDKIKAMIELLQPLGIKEVARSGQVAMARGPKTLSGDRRAAPRPEGPRAEAARAAVRAEAAGSESPRGEGPGNDGARPEAPRGERPRREGVAAGAGRLKDVPDEAS